MSVSFKQRRYNAADCLFKAAQCAKDSKLNLFEAALETGRQEEIRVAHNEAVDAFAEMLMARETRERILLEVNGINPDLRHVP